jgi:hypothetical protein
MYFTFCPFLSLLAALMRTDNVRKIKVARSKKIKSPNLAISSFKKGQILENEKSPNKGQISFKKIVKISKLKFTIS